MNIHSPQLRVPAIQHPTVPAALPARSTEVRGDEEERALGTDAFEAHGLAAELEASSPEVSMWKTVALGGMIALSLGGALASHPASAATIYGVSNAGPSATVTVGRTGGMATTVKAPTAPAPAAQPAVPTPPPAPAAPATAVTSRPVNSIADTKTYIMDMLEANEFQTGSAITYQNALKSNVHTLDRIGWAIRNTPGAESDAQLKRVQQKIKAASDSMGVDFTYEQWNETLSSRDGWSKKNYEVKTDYSGAARMTDNTIESIQRIMHYQKVNR